MKIILRKKSKTKPEIAVECELIERLAGYGFSPKEIADILGVTQRQFSLAKKSYTALAEALKTGNSRADKTVVESLFRKAVGYERHEVQFVKFQGKVRTHPVVRYYPPELNAIIFWLKNRRPAEWKEKVEENKNGFTAEQLEAMRQIAYERMIENL